MARQAFENPSGVGEWNPFVLFGVNFVGREAFLHPYSVGKLFGFFFSDPKQGIVLVTLIFLAAMGLSIFILMRKLEIRTPCALIGVAMYMLAPKWADDGYHGPIFIIAYAALPLILVVILNMYEHGFRLVRHYVQLAALAAVAYLGAGAWVLVVCGYIFVSFFLYLLFMYNLENRLTVRQVLARTTFYSLLSLGLFLLLSAYILFPFTESYLLSQRSLAGVSPGFSWSYYLGLIFPWINRIYADGLYDYVYYSNFPLWNSNLIYFGILTVPVVAYGSVHRVWNKITVFFLVLPVLWLILWNCWAVKIIPLMHFLERLTSGAASQYHGHVVMILSFAVTVGFILDRVTKNSLRTEETVATSGDRYLGWLGRLLIFVYLAVAIVFVCGVVVYNTGLKDYFWHRIMNRDHLIVYYYFRYAALTFIGAFVIRAAIVWIYHKKYFVSTAGAIALLVLAIADFQLCFAIWVPFANLDEKYSLSLPQNRFVGEQVRPLERIGTFQYQLYRPDPKLYSEFMTTRGEQDPQRLLEGFARLYYKGIASPDFEPSFTWFPLTIGRSQYNFHESLMPKYFWDFDKALNSGNPEYTRQSWIGLWDPQSRLLDVAGIDYVIWHDKVTNPRLVEASTYDNGKGLGYIYRNPGAVPRAYVASTVELYDQRSRLLDRIGEPGFDPRKTVTTEDAELFTLMKNHGPSEQFPREATIVQYGPNKVTVSAAAGSNAVLVLNDMYYPNWKATIDGNFTKIFRVNCLFRGVVLPPGNHTVEFSYYNPWFHRGIVVSALSWGAVVLFLGFASIREKRHPDSGRPWSST